MIRVNNEYLDLVPGDEVEIDSQIKLFEELDTTAGDFSYSFELAYTAKNFAALGFPAADTADKTIYNDIPCDIVGKDGIPIYTGKLRIERINSRSITASFFSGNYNWMSLLSGNISDLDFSEYDAEINESNIINYSVNTDGLVFPLVDLGGLATRSYHYLKLGDFTGALYVKTIFRKIMFRNGLKFNGEILNDWLYNNTIIIKDNRNAEAIENRSSYANKTSNQTVVDKAAYTVILFQDDSTYPFYDGSTNLFSTATYRYTPDVSMSIKIEVSLVISMNTQLNSQWYRINKNGSTEREYKLTYGPGASPPTNYNFSSIIDVAAGEYVQIDIKSDDSIGVNTGVQSGSTIKITPVFVFRVFGNSMVPNWTQKDFILSFLNLFNVVSDYNPVSKTVTFNYFEKIKTKTPIDISQYVDPSTIETDFAEFISAFGKRNYLSYQEGDDEDLREYNVKEFVKYGAGVIEVDNDFIEDEKDIIESGFTTPISYLNVAFDASLERINLNELEEGDTTTFASVTDASGEARLIIADDYFSDYDLVRVAESTVPAYNGDWVGHATGAGFIHLYGLSFNGTAAGKITKLNYKYTNNDNIYLLIHIPFYDVSNFSTLPEYYLEANLYSAMSFAFFNLLDTNNNVNDYKQGLSFGEVNNPLSYQKTLIDTYWRSVSGVLSDPVKIIAQFHFPESVFRLLTPLTPVYLKTEETVNMYYINRIRGYAGSHRACLVELIKL